MSDIVEKLRQLADAKVGDPLPACLSPTETKFEHTITSPNSGVAIGFGTNDWGTPLSLIAAEAIAEIERLRTYVRMADDADKYASFPSFLDIKKDIRCVDPLGIQGKVKMGESNAE